MAAKKYPYDENHPTHVYARDIVAGKIIVGEKEKLLAKKHLKDLKRQNTKAFPYVFDHTRANRFFEFFEMCFDYENNRYYKLMPHQYLDFGIQFGWVEKETGAYKYIRVYKQQSRAAAKTTECAIKAPYKLIGERIYLPFQVDEFIRVRNAQVYLMAVDKTQLEELRDPIALIARNSPKIKPFIKVRETYIRGEQFGGKIVLLSKEFTNKMGGKPSYAIVDELSSHLNGRRISALEKGFGKKEQAQMDIITTPGESVESNPAKKEYDYATQVLRGDIVDESFLGIIREQDENDDISNPDLWQKSNPFLRYLSYYRYSKTLFDTIQREYKRAFEGNDPEAQRQFRIYRMGMWQERSVRSFLKSKDIRLYGECAVSQAEFKKLVTGRQCIAGFDFSLRVDLTACAYIWQLENGDIAIDAIGFIPLDTVKSHEQSDRIPYSEYEKLGILFTTLSHMTNREEFAHIVCRKIREYECTIKEICYDPYHARECAEDFANGKYDSLGAGIFSEDNIIEIIQRNTVLHIPTTRLRDKLRERQIVHNGNPLLKWCLTNCFEFESKAGGLIRLGKENKDSHRRIDLAAAAVNAMTRVDSLKVDRWVERMSEATDNFF